MNKERSAKNQYFLDLADLNGRTDVIEFMKGKVIRKLSIWRFNSNHIMQYVPSKY